MCGLNPAVLGGTHSNNKISKSVTYLNCQPLSICVYFTAEHSNRADYTTHCLCAVIGVENAHLRK